MSGLVFFCLGVICTFAVLTFFAWRKALADSADGGAE